MKTLFLILVSVFIFQSCKPQAKDGENVSDQKLKINQIQVIGSHNSYKQAIDPALLDTIRSKGSSIVLNLGDRNIDVSTILTWLEYEHIPIPAQLDLGLRNLEFDVYADTVGGTLAHPAGLGMIDSARPYDPDSLMLKPGFKVVHVPDIDFRSSCLTFSGCLLQLRDWSEANPDHIPVFITLEAKEDGLPQFDRNPEKYTGSIFNKLDDLIRADLGEDKLITPDMVRGDYATLNEAVLNENWPTLDECKGKFLFILDARGKKGQLYIQGHPSLKGRVLFVNADPGTPEAATLIRNNPQDSTITELVKSGYIIRTRADENTREARENDYTRFHAACRSGAQIITTDYYKKSTFFNSPYHVAFEDSTYVRPNPLFISEKADRK